MIDTAHPVGSFTVEPMEEAAFRLSMSPTAATNRYASHKLKIVTARNTQAFF
jgi:hypothetical protein